MIADKKAWMAAQDIPWLIRTTILVPRCDKFETTVAGKYVNGVDIIRCNEAGRIVEFRVMIRPLQAVNAVHQQMAATLERMSSQG